MAWARVRDTRERVVIRHQEPGKLDGFERAARYDTNRVSTA